MIAPYNYIVLWPLLTMNTNYDTKYYSYVPYTTSNLITNKDLSLKVYETLLNNIIKEELKPEKF